VVFVFGVGGNGHARVRKVEDFGRLPFSFELNQGQTAPQVSFLARGNGYTIYFTAAEAVLVLRKGHGDALGAAVLRTGLVGSNAAPRVSGLDRLPGKSNYFIGAKADERRTNVATYGKVRYHDVYPGIDLVYYGNQGRLEYDFIVAPGADPQTVALEFKGADKLEVDSQGDLVVHVAGGQLRLHKPTVYQGKEGERRQIPGRYELRDKHLVGFSLAAYDKRKTLVIDPVLAYSTYLGGVSTDTGYAIAGGSDGSTYIAGQTYSADFPVLDALQPTKSLSSDAFVAKLSADGSTLIYSTYLGGSDVDAASGVAADGAGAAYVTGGTRSTDFPTANALQPAFGGYYDAFVTKLSPDGSALVYSTYLGGDGIDSGRGIAADADGNAYVTGSTRSLNFPVFNALKPTTNPWGEDGFVSKINATGAAFVYSTYLGGADWDTGYGIAADAAGAAYVGGATRATDFPTVNAFQPITGGSIDAFVSKLSADGTAFVYSTYLGGATFDYGQDIAVGPDGAACVTGYTDSADFPTAGALQSTYGGGYYDGFVAKLDPAGAALVYSTYLGGTNRDEGFAIAADPSGAVCVTGFTNSVDFPTADALQPAAGGGLDAFVTKISDDGAALVYSTYWGGSGSDVGWGIAADAAGAALICGSTSSTDFPTANALQPTLAGASDAFVTKITEVLTPEEMVAAIAETILDLPQSAFRKGNWRDTFLNKLDAVLDQIADDDIEGAIRKLTNDIRAKMDGCLVNGAPDRNDKITDCEAQHELAPLVDGLIELLEAQL